MKRLYIVLVHLAVSLSAFTQEDTNMNKDFIFNKFGFISVRKIGTVLDSVPYKMGIEWKVVGYYKKYDWQTNQNYLIVTNDKDTGWIMKSVFDENLNKRGTVFSALDFKNRAISFTPEEFFKIMNGIPWIGMNEEALLLSYGKPLIINRTINEKGVYKQYVYDDLYFYFENGKLSTIQD